VQYKDNPPQRKLQERKKKRVIFKKEYVILTVLSAISIEIAAIIADVPG